MFSKLFTSALLLAGLTTQTSHARSTEISDSNKLDSRLMGLYREIEDTLQALSVDHQENDELVELNDDLEEDDLQNMA